MIIIKWTKNDPENGLKFKFDLKSFEIIYQMLKWLKYPRSFVIFNLKHSVSAIYKNSQIFPKKANNAFFKHKKPKNNSV